MAPPAATKNMDKHQATSRTIEVDVGKRDTPPRRPWSTLYRTNRTWAAQAKEAARIFAQLYQIL